MIKMLASSVLVLFIGLACGCSGNQAHKSEFDNVGSELPKNKDNVHLEAVSRVSEVKKNDASLVDTNILGALEFDESGMPKEFVKKTSVISAPVSLEPEN